jgi:DNA processing protein
MNELYYLQPNDEAYPTAFKQLFEAPKGVYAYGNLKRLKDMPALSVVGTRRVSAYGRDVTVRLARAAAEQGIAIISGLALGVDSLAHRAALEAGGYTVAVLANGLDTIHPKNHRALAQQIIAAGGAVISEYALGVPALKHQFIERNRLVAALGDALLITEAALKSGTMHTVRFALEMNKTVMAVPGNINSSTSDGTNNLLKRGAILVTDVNDILFELGLERTIKTTVPQGSSPAETTIIELIQRGTSDINKLLATSQLPATTFNQSLTMLELTGKIRSLGGGQWGLS